MEHPQGCLVDEVALSRGSFVDQTAYLHFQRLSPSRPLLASLLRFLLFAAPAADTLLGHLISLCDPMLGTPSFGKRPPRILSPRIHFLSTAYWYRFDMGKKNQAWSAVL